MNKNGPTHLYIIMHVYTYINICICIYRNIYVTAQKKRYRRMREQTTHRRLGYAARHHAGDIYLPRKL